jgi:hypothetical protein
MGLSLYQRDCDERAKATIQREVGSLKGCLSSGRHCKVLNDAVSPLNLGTVEGWVPMAIVSCKIVTLHFLGLWVLFVCCLPFVELSISLALLFFDLWLSFSRFSIEISKIQSFFLCTCTVFCRVFPYTC